MAARRALLRTLRALLGAVGTLNVAPGDLVWFLGDVVTMPCDGKAVLRLVVAADDVTVYFALEGVSTLTPECCERVWLPVHQMGLTGGLSQTVDSYSCV